MYQRSQGQRSCPCGSSCRSHGDVDNQEDGSAPRGARAAVPGFLVVRSCRDFCTSHDDNRGSICSHSPSTSHSGATDANATHSAHQTRPPLRRRIRQKDQVTSSPPPTVLNQRHDSIQNFSHDVIDASDDVTDLIIQSWCLA